MNLIEAYRLAKTIEKAIRKGASEDAKRQVYDEVTRRLFGSVRGERIVSASRVTQYGQMP